MFYSTNEFAHMCKSTKNFLDVFESMKEQINILKVEIAERKDREMNTDIWHATLKLDEMLARTISSVRAEADYKKQIPTVAKGEEVPKRMSNKEYKKQPSTLPTAEILAVDQRKKMEIPPANIRLEITFIFNVLNEQNLKEKAADIKKSVKKRYLPWLANYIVVKRAMAEAKFQDLHSNLIDILKSDLLNSLILVESLQQLKVLLRSTERTIKIKTCMENLALWLGKLTLAKGRPIPVVDIHITRFVKYHMAKQSSNIHVEEKKSHCPTENITSQKPTLQLVQQSAVDEVLPDDEYIITRSSPEYIATKMNKSPNLVATSSYLNGRIKKNFINLQIERN